MKISDSLDPHNLDGVKLKALWLLDKIESSTKDRFTASEISKVLVEDYGISTTRQAVQSALSREKVIVHKNSSGYKLMEKGRVQLKDQILTEAVVMIEAGKPFTAKNIDLKKVFSSLSGEISISDPYIDIQTLDLIFKHVDKTHNVRILTKNIIEKPSGILLRHLTELRNEGYQIEVGIYSSSDLHDRYLMDQATFWLSGNSLNNLGKKESFIVRLGEDIRQSMMATFNSRWKSTLKM